MVYKSQEAYEHAAQQMREEAKGEWQIGAYTIRRSKPFNLLVIQRDDGKPVHKSLTGQWTEVEAAKNAIRSLTGSAYE